MTLDGTRMSRRGPGSEEAMVERPARAAASVMRLPRGSPATMVSSVISGTAAAATTTRRLSLTTVTPKAVEV